MGEGIAASVMAIGVGALASVGVVVGIIAAGMYIVVLVCWFGGATAGQR